MFYNFINCKIKPMFRNFTRFKNIEKRSYLLLYRVTVSNLEVKETNFLLIVDGTVWDLTVVLYVSCFMMCQTFSLGDIFGLQELLSTPTLYLHKNILYVVCLFTYRYCFIPSHVIDQLPVNLIKR